MSPGQGPKSPVCPLTAVPTAPHWPCLYLAPSPGWGHCVSLDSCSWCWLKPLRHWRGSNAACLFSGGPPLPSCSPRVPPFALIPGTSCPWTPSVTPSQFLQRPGGGAISSSLSQLDQGLEHLRCQDSASGIPSSISSSTKVLLLKACMVLYLYSVGNAGGAL